MLGKVTPIIYPKLASFLRMARVLSMFDFVSLGLRFFICLFCF